MRDFEERLLAARDESGVTVLMVSHDLAQVRRLADVVIVLDRTVQRRGAPSEALEHALGTSLELAADARARPA